MKKHIILSILSLFAVVAHPATAQEVPDSVETTGGRGLSLSGEDIQKRMAGDIRESLKGVIPGLHITTQAGGWFTADYSSNHIADSQVDMMYRGATDMTCIIDGIVVPFNQFSLDPSQIESITFVGDIVSRAKYGPMSTGGSLSITTRTGGYNQPLTVNVNAEAGVAAISVLPEWVDGVDYAIMNNEARANAGYTQLYSPLAIQNFLRKDAYDIKYPNVDYKSLFIRPMTPVGNASVQISGGGKNVKYAASLSELYSGDIQRGNRPLDYNRINFSSNVTTRIKDFITINAGFNSLLSFRQANSVDWNGYMSVPPVAFPVILGVNTSDAVADDLEGLTIYGSTSQYSSNPYAQLMEGGHYVRKVRSAMIFTNAEIDFGRWVKGLKSTTGVSYSTFSAYDLTKPEDYLAYYWDPEAEDGKGVISPSHQGAKSSSRTHTALGTTQTLQLKERLSWQWNKNGHDVDLGGSFLMYNAAVQGDGRYRRMVQFIADGKYSFKNRYILEGVFQYAGSSRYDWQHRFCPFGSVGAAWVASNEPFLKDVSWIDNLKISAQWGVLGQYGNVFGSSFRYISSYSQGNSGTFGPALNMDTWLGNKTWVAQKSSITQLANPNLDWEKQRMWEVNLNFDFLKDFSFQATLYKTDALGLIADVESNIPALYGIRSVTVYENAESNMLNGYEVSLGWHHNFGDFRLHAGASLYGWNKIYTSLVNDYYLYDYQKKTGTSTSTVRGFQCIGKYETQEQLDKIPSYSTVAIGDLMYKDQNSDGVIDSNDMVPIGDSRPDLCYSVRLGFDYRGLSFEAIGTGVGKYDFMCSSSYFWNGWGDGNYSAFVRDNLGGAYPRLSYDKSANNFVESDFWLRNGAWFKLQNVLLSYEIPLKNKNVVKGLSVKIEGQNLATISSLEYVDPESPDSGISTRPLFRTFTAGVKIKF